MSYFGGIKVGHGIGKTQIKILECLSEKPHFLDELMNKVGSNVSYIRNTMRRLCLRGYNVMKFKPPSSRCGRDKGHSYRIKDGYAPTICYFERDKLKAYEMLMERIENKVYDYQKNISKPMLGGYV